MPPKIAGGRGRGVPNYKKDILMNIIADILPTGALAWQRVAERYRISSSENIDREYIKRFFIQKLCNNNKKPNREASGEIKRAQDIHRRMLLKENAGHILLFLYIFLSINISLLYIYRNIWR
jgi:hypothetical protein